MNCSHCDKDWCLDDAWWLLDGPEGELQFCDLACLLRWVMTEMEASEADAILADYLEVH